MVAEILESFQTNDFSSQLDSIKKELESLTQLNPSDQLLSYMKEKTRELEQLSENIDEIEDHVLIQRLKNIINIINDIINKLQYHPEDNALKENIRRQYLEDFNNFSTYLGVRIVILEVKGIIGRLRQSKDILKQCTIINEVLKSLTVVVNSY